MFIMHQILNSSVGFPIEVTYIDDNENRNWLRFNDFDNLNNTMNAIEQHESSSKIFIHNIYI